MSTVDPTPAAVGRYLQRWVRVDPRPYQARAAHAQRAVAALLARVNNPQRRLRIVHVAGSKGKGSTALLLERLLQTAGFRAGTFTSPHLRCWTERFRIGGRAADAAALATALNALAPHAEALADDDVLAPSFFDLATAAALWLFAASDVDYAIIETGLGGRLDATNVVTPLLTAITSIEREHVDKLGTTLAAIAAEKAGIIKPGVAVVSGRLPPPAAVVVAARAAAQRAPLLRAGREFRQRALADGRLRYREADFCSSYRLAALGAPARANAALALACARRLALADGWHDALAAAVAPAYADALLPGRCEVLKRVPWILVDSAHTGASAAALRREIDRLGARRVRWLLSFASGKDAPAIARALLRPRDAVILTRAETQRTQPPQALAAALAALSPTLSITVEEDLAQAVALALTGLNDDDLLCLAGSVYLAGYGGARVRARLAASGSNGLA